MKDITITLTPIQAALIFRIFGKTNINAIFLPSFIEKCLFLRSGNKFKEEVEKEFVGPKDSVWSKLDKEFEKQGISNGFIYDPCDFTIDGKSVTFSEDGISIGDVHISRKDIDFIHKKLSEENVS